MAIVHRVPHMGRMGCGGLWRTIVANLAKKDLNG